jgi:hypothetical protein
MIMDIITDILCPSLAIKMYKTRNVLDDDTLLERCTMIHNMLKTCTHIEHLKSIEKCWINNKIYCYSFSINKNLLEFYDVLFYKVYNDVYKKLLQE